MLHAAATYTLATITALAVLTGQATTVRSTEDAAGHVSTGGAGRSVTALVPSSAPADGDRCGAEPTTAAGWQRLFDGLSGTWAGGDGASSVRLPDGRLLWLFGDTFHGTTTATGARTSTSVVRNSVVVTDGTCARPLTTTVDALPGRGATWLWTTHAVVTRAATASGTSQLTVFAQRVSRTGAGPFDFRRTGTAVVSMSVPWLGTPRVGAVDDLPDGTILWGAAVVPDGAVTWVYGTRAVRQTLVFGRELLLARAPTSTLGDTSTWSYRTANGWSPRPDSAHVLRPARLGVSTVPSAMKAGSTYLIVTKPQEFLDARIVLLSASTPWGPWTERVVGSAPSTSTVPRYSPALVVPTRGGHLVVVVSRTATTATALRDHAAWSRPTFFDVPQA